MDCLCDRAGELFVGMRISWLKAYAWMDGRWKNGSGVAVTEKELMSEVLLSYCPHKYEFIDKMHRQLDEWVNYIWVYIHEKWLDGRMVILCVWRNRTVFFIWCYDIYTKFHKYSRLLGGKTGRHTDVMTVYHKSIFCRLWNKECGR